MSFPRHRRRRGPLSIHSVGAHRSHSHSAAAAARASPGTSAAAHGGEVPGSEMMRLSMNGHVIQGDTIYLPSGKTLARPRYEDDIDFEPACFHPDMADRILSSLHFDVHANAGKGNRAGFFLRFMHPDGPEAYIPDPPRDKIEVVHLRHTMYWLAKHHFGAQVFGKSKQLSMKSIRYLLAANDAGVVLHAGAPGGSAISGGSGVGLPLTAHTHAASSAADLRAAASQSRLNHNFDAAALSAPTASALKEEADVKNELKRRGLENEYEVVRTFTGEVAIRQVYDNPKKFAATFFKTKPKLAKSSGDTPPHVARERQRTTRAGMSKYDVVPHQHSSTQASQEHELSSASHAAADANATGRHQGQALGGVPQAGHTKPKTTLPLASLFASASAAAAASNGVVAADAEPSLKPSNLNLLQSTSDIVDVSNTFCRPKQQQPALQVKVNAASASSVNDRKSRLPPITSVPSDDMSSKSFMYSHPQQSPRAANKVHATKNPTTRAASTHNVQPNRDVLNNFAFTNGILPSHENAAHAREVPVPQNDNHFDGKNAQHYNGTYAAAAARISSQIGREPQEDALPQAEKQTLRPPPVASTVRPQKPSTRLPQEKFRLIYEDFIREEECKEWEFKKGHMRPAIFEDTLLRYAIGFLNADVDGTIAFGVTDERRVVGLTLNYEARDKMRCQIDALFRNKLKPIQLPSSCVAVDFIPVVHRSATSTIYQSRHVVKVKITLPETNMCPFGVYHDSSNRVWEKFNGSCALMSPGNVVRRALNARFGTSDIGALFSAATFAASKQLGANEDGGYAAASATASPFVGVAATPNLVAAAAVAAAAAAASPAERRTEEEEKNGERPRDGLSTLALPQQQQQFPHPGESATGVYPLQHENVNHATNVSQKPVAAHASAEQNLVTPPPSGQKLVAPASNSSKASSTPSHSRIQSFLDPQLTELLLLPSPSKAYDASMRTSLNGRNSPAVGPLRETSFALSADHRRASLAHSDSAAGGGGARGLLTPTHTSPMLTRLNGADNMRSYVSSPPSVSSSGLKSNHLLSPSRSRTPVTAPMSVPAVDPRSLSSLLLKSPSTELLREL